MLLAALTAGWLLCLGVGVLLGLAVSHQRDYTSGWRDALDALERLHDHQPPTVRPLRVVRHTGRVE